VSKATLARELSTADLVIDALLGTGRARAVQGALKAVMDAVNAQADRVTLLAVDLPTGVNADSGAVDDSALRADVTITLGFPKVGLFAFPAAGHVGRLVVGDIGLPPEIADDVPTELTTQEEVALLLPKRALDGHKGSFGKVMVVGGSVNYIGAPTLASLAAGRVGAGLVTLACAASLHPLYAVKLTETTFFPLPEDAAATRFRGTPRQKGILGEGAAGRLLGELQGYDVLLLGVGLGRAETTRRMVQLVLDGLRAGAGERATSISCVVDADGLNALAGHRDWPSLLPERVVLTPHSGEMARLMAIDISAVNTDRLAVARKAATRSGAVIVLKGAYTIVAAPDGRAHINPTANPALATAGTGDVLSGTIAGLLAQGLAPYDAAVAGVYLHAQAGEIATAQLGDAGLLASDLLPLLPRAIKALKD
jgi:NAD(P)H-hydrate epimerase